MIRAVVPAPPSAALEVAPATRLGRGLVILQSQRHHSIAVYAGDELLAVVMFIRYAPGRLELCLGVRPAARRHLLAILKLAHLSLPLIAETEGDITATVNPLNRAGRRLARLAGFHPSEELSGRRMIWRH